jgi:hypothetical protein
LLVRDPWFDSKGKPIAAETGKQHSKQTTCKRTAKTSHFEAFSEKLLTKPDEIMEFLGFCTNSWM